MFLRDFWEDSGSSLGGIWEVFGRHLGEIQEAPRLPGSGLWLQTLAGAIWKFCSEVSGRHLGGLWEASGKHLGELWEAPGLPGSGLPPGSGWRL